MKLFKIVDLSISLSLIICSIMIFFFADQLFVFSYSLLIAWQLTSMLVHVFNKWFTGKRNLRVVYNWTTITILLLAAILVFTPFSFFLLYIMIVIWPIMSGMYVCLCYDEIKRLNTRPLGLYK